MVVSSGYTSSPLCCSTRSLVLFKNIKSEDAYIMIPKHNFFAAFTSTEYQQHHRYSDDVACS